MFFDRIQSVTKLQISTQEQLVIHIKLRSLTFLQQEGILYPQTKLYQEKKTRRKRREIYVYMYFYVWYILPKTPQPLQLSFFAISPLAENIMDEGHKIFYKIVPNTQIVRVYVSSHTHMFICNDGGWIVFLCKYFSRKEFIWKLKSFLFTNLSLSFLLSSQVPHHVYSSIPFTLSPSHHPGGCTDHLRDELQSSFLCTLPSPSSGLTTSNHHQLFHYVVPLFQKLQWLPTNHRKKCPNFFAQ